MPSLLACDEPKPFHVIQPASVGRWVITCDHASNRIPRALGRLGLPDAEIARHIGWDIGAAAVTQGLAARLNAWAILQNYSRLVIDCNRHPGTPTSIPVRSENTDIPGNVGISPEHAAQRRTEIFDPYHAAIAAELDTRARAGRATLFVALHSFTPVYDGAARAMHAAVLYNRDVRLARALFHRLAAEPGLIVADNEPYRVTDESDYGVPVHCERRGLPYVEFEIRQDLIAQAEGQAAWIDRLASLLPLAACDIGF
jgi:predicted N-formylglutamate amidohydrolase